MMSMAIRINDFLTGLFLGIGIRLVDFKLEFGRLYEGDMVRTVLADEISPDSCRLWDIQTHEKLDKDRFRRDLGGLIEAYQEVARRLGILTETEKPEALAPKLVKSGSRLVHEGKDHHHAQERRPRSARQGDRGRAHRAWLCRRGQRPPGQVYRARPRRSRPARAEQAVKAMCDRLLANTVIENYDIELA
jgi:hypothetical protein